MILWRSALDSRMLGNAIPRIESEYMYSFDYEMIGRYVDAGVESKSIVMLRIKYA